MRFLDEYRDPVAARQYVAALKRLVRRPWVVMEICGGQTHTLIRAGIDQLLPERVTLVHGPGCPVCVTPVAWIDGAIRLAQQPGVVLTSFGDMLRVPGSETDLLAVKARGGQVRVVYSPLDALRLAQQNPEQEVVFFAVGFETTAPSVAMAVWQAHRLGLRNFSILNAHVRVPPAIRAILSAPHNQVQGFLAPGHVCAVMGYWEYEPLAAEFRVPIVVTGFEPLDLLQGLYMVLRALEEGRWGVENQYARVVSREGNRAAQRLMQRVFQPCDRPWRGMGVVPEGGLCLRSEFAAHDAARKFALQLEPTREDQVCIAGAILQGHKKPPDCPAFGRQCTPEHPLGAPMVSSEGACAAYYRYGRFQRA